MTKRAEKIVKGAVKAYTSVETAVVDGYKAIEGVAVGGYKAVESATVDAYKRIEDTAVRIGHSLVEEYDRQKSAKKSEK